METKLIEGVLGIMFSVFGLAVISYFLPVGTLSSTKHQTLFASATSARESVETSEQKYLESMDVMLDRLKAAIHLIDPNDLLGERLTIAELRQLIEPMRAKAREVLEAHAQFGSAAEDFENEAAKAIPLMTEVANSFASYAEQESFPDLQESYRTVSESLVAVANKIQERKSQIGPAIQAVSTNIVYVERSELFLVRLQEVLDVVPEEGPASEGFLRRVAEYVQAFERLRELLQKFHRATTGEIKSANESVPQSSVSRPDHAPITDIVADLTGPRVEQLQDDLLTEDKRNAKSEAPLATVLTLERDVHRTTEVADTVPQKLPIESLPAVTTHDLTGLWNVGNGNVRIRVRQSGRDVAVSLHRGSIEAHGYGKLRFIDNDTLMVVELVYIHRDGQHLRENGLIWEIVGSDSIRARSYRHVPTQDGGIRRTQHVVHYDVHRIHSKFCQAPTTLTH